MGNTNAKQLKKPSDSRRSQLIAVIMRRKVNRSTSMTLPDATGFSFITSKPVTRRMAIFGVDYEKSQVKVENEVDVDFAYQVARSTVLVDPSDLEESMEYRTYQKHIHGTDSEKVFKEIAQNIFKVHKASPKRRSSQKIKDKE